MATNWPNSVQTFTNPTSGSALNSPSHADQHATVNDTVEALQTYAGLTAVKSVTVGSGVSSVTVTGVTGYANYLFIFDRIDSSGGALMQIDSSDLTSATGWKGTTLLWQGVATATVYNLTGNPVCYCGLLDTNGSAMRVIIYNPNFAGRTRFESQGIYVTYPFISGGQYDADTTTDQFTFSPSSGTLTGGTIRVYGFNEGA